MYSIIKNSLLLTIFCTILFSCKKNSDRIGLDLQPGEDLLTTLYTDTFTIITHTVKDDTIATNSFSPMLLGTMNDPDFGLTSASIYTQFTPSTESQIWGKNPILDSAVLSIVYYNKQYYGTLHPQKFSVYELNELMSLDSTYYSNKTILTGKLLGSSYQVPAIVDSVTVGTERFPSHLRIRLDKNYFQKLISTDDTTHYANAADFQQNVLKGICIKSETYPFVGEGAILSIDATNQFSSISLYYHNNAEDSLSYFLGISNISCARFTHFDHDYSKTPDINNQLNTNSKIQQDYVYVQPMAGVRTKISIPSLMHLVDSGKIAINKAELIMNVESSSIRKYTYNVPPRIILTIADSTLGPILLPDYYESFFGGTYITAPTSGGYNHYTFNIPRHIQSVIDGRRTNQDLYILSVLRPTSTNRLQLIGGDKKKDGYMKLKVTYTPLKR